MLRNTWEAMLDMVNSVLGMGHSMLISAELRPELCRYLW